MKGMREIAVVAAAGCESASAIALLRGAGAPALFLHVAASACMAALLHRRVLVGPGAWAFALIFAAALFIPLLGISGVIAVSLAVPGGASATESRWIATRIPRPPEPAGVPESADARSPSRKARIAALADLRDRCDPDAVARLRAALDDGDEDVRLLAHALLDAKNRAACRRIDATSASLDEAPEDGRAALHRKLAAQHWEVAWAGLVQGECLEHALAEARRHAMAALERDPGSATLHFLLGRIELRLGSPTRAELALLRSRELGMPARVAAPYLAEAAFLRRRFDMVRSHLASCGSAPTSAVRGYWS